MNINKYLPESRPKRFWKSLTNYNPVTFIQLFFNNKIKRIPRISSLPQEQRRQAALRRSRSQYAQNASQIRTRNAQHIALARTSNLEAAEEARPLLALREGEAKEFEPANDWGTLRIALPVERDAEAHASARSNSEERRRQQVQNRGKSRTRARTGRCSARNSQVGFRGATTRAVANHCCSCYLEIDRGK